MACFGEHHFKIGHKNVEPWVGKIHVYENNLSSKSVSFGFRKMSFIFLDVTLQTLQGYGTCFYTKNLFPMKLCGSFFVCAMMCRIQRQKLTLKVKRNLVVIFHFFSYDNSTKKVSIIEQEFQCHCQSSSIWFSSTIS